jgi:hypothetical protein
VDTIRILADYLLARIQAVRGKDAELGALSLEWIVIAVALVVAAGVAAALFKNAIENAASQLP